MTIRVQHFRHVQQWLTLAILFVFFHISHADVGTAAHYSAPYVPTACYGDDQSVFPPNKVFAAAGEGIWDDGAACGRQYLVACLSAPGSSCLSNTIQVKIVDRAATAESRPSRDGATLVLSPDAYAQLVKSPSTKFINVEYKQV